MADEVTVYPTRDEAIAMAFSESEEGDEVLIHAPDCRLDDATGSPCSCSPAVHVVRRAVA